MIAASQIHHLSDISGLFQQDLLGGGGRAASCMMYRPLFSTFVGLQHHLWGLRSWPYHATSLALLAVCAVVLYVTLVRLRGDKGVIGPAIGVAYFLLHPAVIDVVSVPARSSELLVTIFLLTTLLCLPVEGDRHPTIRRIVAGITTMVALGFKEIGVIGVGLIVIHQLLYDRRKTALSHIVTSVGSAVPACICIVVYFAVRISVLGGLGGYSGVDPAMLVSRAFSSLSTFCEILFHPPRLSGAGSAAAIAGLISLIGICTLVIMAFFVRGKPDRRLNKSIAIGMAWIVMAVIVYGLAVRIASFHLLSFLPGVSMVLAAMFSARRSDSCTARRYTGVVRSLRTVMIVLVLSALHASALFVDYAKYRNWSAAQAGFFATLTVAISDIPFGVSREVAVPRSLPEPFNPERTGRGGRGVVGANNRQLTRPASRISRRMHKLDLLRFRAQAWAQLAFRNVNARIETRQVDPTGIAKCEKVIVLRPEPSLDRQPASSQVFRATPD
ncbi:MAG: hypothetical protein V3T70_07185 [Phycisphaerae bacterium]